MMKKTLTALITASALSLAIPSAAQAAWWNFGGDKAEHKVDHKCEHHKKGMRGENRGFRELELSDAQKDKIREIRREQRETFRQKMDAVLTPEQRDIVAKHEAKRAEHREQRAEKSK